MVLEIDYDKSFVPSAEKRNAKHRPRGRGFVEEMSSFMRGFSGHIGEDS